MKTVLALILTAVFAMPAVAADEAPKTKQVCVDVMKDGKPVVDPKTKKTKQSCKTVKVHKKHEGTEVPGKK